MSRQSLEVLRRTVTVEWPAADAESARKFLTATARADNEKILAAQQSRGGMRPSVTAYANTPGNRNLDAVTLPGPIVHNYQYFAEIVVYALAALAKASPVASGDYLAGHTVYVNGVAVERFDRLDDADQIMIANAVPYARRLEIGKTVAGRDFVLQVPNRIYETVAKRILAPRFGNVARIEFGYASLPDSYAVKGRLASHYATGRANGVRGGGVLRKRQQKPGGQVRAPAIFIGNFR